MLASRYVSWRFCVLVVFAMTAGLLSGAVSAQGCDGHTFFDYSILAGPSTGLGHEDGSGAAARFYAPYGLALAPSGDEFYVADSLNHVIRKVTLSGEVTTVAGVPGSPGWSDGMAAGALFNEPHGIAVNDLGVIFVADYGNHVIRRIDLQGTVTTVAGLPGTAGEADGVGSQARFNGPWGILADNEGNIVVSDALGHTLRFITPFSEVVTVGGKANTPGHADGTTQDSLFNSPRGIAVDGDLNVWVADSGNQVIRVVLIEDGSVLTAAGGIGQTGTQDGAGTVARFNQPTSLVWTDEELIIADSGNYSLRSMTIATGATFVSTYAGKSGLRGYVDSDGTNARFDNPVAVVTDLSGGIVVAEGTAGTIRRLNLAGVASTLAGTRRESGSADGLGSEARFDTPWDAVFDTAGNLYVSDRANHTVRRITPSGEVTTVAGAAGEPGTLDGGPGVGRLQSPAGLEIDGQGNLYVADSGNHAIRKIDQFGNLTTYAGTLGLPGAGNGALTQSTFRNPEDVAFDAEGNLYVADKGNSTIRRAGAAGVTLFAGAASVSGTTDGTRSVSRFRSPSGIDVAPDGTIYVADAGAHTIRRISGDNVSTVAGLADQTGTTGGSGPSARFNAPSGLTIDAAGNVYIADRKNMSVRRLATSGIVTTVGGTSGRGGTEEGFGPLAVLSEPTGVAMSAIGQLHVVSSGNAVVQRGSAVAPLCLEGERFALGLTAVDPRLLDRGVGLAIPQNGVFGYFAIPDLTNNPGNPEVFAKVLDGRGNNGNFWVFYGGLTDFEYDLVVTDVVGGGTKVYHKDGGGYCGGADTSAFADGGTASIPSELMTFKAAQLDAPELTGAPEATCGVDALCLSSNRFTITLAAKDPRTQVSGAGVPIPQTDLFGYFVIPDLTGNVENPEVFVKVLDGTEYNGKFWVFYGGLTDFEYTLTVNDTQTQSSKQYKKDGFTFCGGADTDAF